MGLNSHITGQEICFSQGYSEQQVGMPQDFEIEITDGIVSLRNFRSSGYDSVQIEVANWNEFVKIINEHLEQANN